MAARAEAAAAAGKGHQELVATGTAPDAGEAAPQIAALEEPGDGVGDDGPPEAVPLLVPLGIDALEVLEEAIEETE
jgi:hypothetical protein